MSPSTCPRSFEVEALHDGRLTGTERAGFEAHVKKCADCTRASRALEELGGRLRAMPAPGGDDLRVRRERTRLLAAFNRALVEPRKQLNFRWIAVAAIAVLTSAASFFFRTNHAPPTNPRNALVHADLGAEWSDHIEGAREIVDLDRGTLSIHVDHGPGARPLLVRLPDGELEDTGTTFTVSVADDKTSSVSVQEGSVVLRVRGSAPVTLEAGSAWSVPTARDVVAVASAAIPKADSDAAAPSSAIAPKPTVAATPSGATSALAADTASTDAAGEFRDATSLLDRGDACEGAGRFAHFIGAHPTDFRIEDAAYLRVLALQRCGDAPATKAAARDYLARFPAGFRRAELEPLAR